MDISDKLKKQIRTFIKGATGFSASEWLGDKHMQVFVRKSHRLVNLRDGSDRFYIEAFDLANMGVKEKYRNQGLAKSLLDFVIAERPFEGVYAENILNPFLIPVVESRGFLLQNPGEASPSYVRLHAEELDEDDPANDYVSAEKMKEMWYGTRKKTEG
jgi:GNAT superfamily N-acetyltransferase